MVLSTEFYFLRHGATDGNALEQPLNPAGIQQANRVHDEVMALNFSSVCSSPLKRAQETKQIILEGAQYEDISLDGLKENVDAALLILRSEQTHLTAEEQSKVDHFLETVRKCMDVVLSKPLPTLVIAHGGIFLAIRHIYQLKLNRIASHVHNSIIENCHLVRISKNAQDEWKVRSNLNTPLLPN